MSYNGSSLSIMIFIAAAISVILIFILFRVMTLKRFILFIFPVYLVVAEYAIRFMLSYAPGKEEDLALAASTSTVTAAGLSLIAPLVIPKPPLPNWPAAPAGFVLVRSGDQKMVAVGWILLLLMPFVWGCALWLVHKGITDYDLTLGGVVFPGPFTIALLVYGIGIILTEIKEVL